MNDNYDLEKMNPVIRGMVKYIKTMYSPQEVEVFKLGNHHMIKVFFKDIPKNISFRDMEPIIQLYGRDNYIVSHALRVMIENNLQQFFQISPSEVDADESDDLEYNVSVFLI